MVKRRTFTLLLLSVLLAGGAVWVANNWLELRTSPQAVAQGNEINVVVASLNIPYGQKLERQHLSVISLPKHTVPGNSYADITEVEGKITTQAILSGEIIRAERVVEHLEGSSLAALIAPKKRAVTLRVDDVIGVAGFLLPGNRVDVLATRMLSSRRALTETILKDIKVLAVDQTSGGEDNEPVVVRAVTLEMKPEQAEELVKSRDEGRIQLVLRNPLEEEPVVVAKAPAPKKKYVRRAPTVTHVTVIRGVTATKTKVKI